MTIYTPYLPVSSDLLAGFDRILVDVGQTGFLEGREFRAFKELSIAGGATYVIRAVTTVNIVLNSLAVVLDAGWLRLSTKTGGTPGGSFSESITALPANNMSPGKNHRSDFGLGSVALYTVTTAITAGGTHTGGTELDVVRVKCAGNSQQASSIGATAFDERGVAPATYYFVLQNLGNDTITGTLKLRWEERP